MTTVNEKTANKIIKEAFNEIPEKINFDAVEDLCLSAFVIKQEEKEYKIKYLTHLGQTPTVIIKAKSAEEAIDKFDNNFKDFDIVKIEENQPKPQDKCMYQDSYCFECGECEYNNNQNKE